MVPMDVDSAPRYAVKAVGTSTSGAGSWYLSTQKKWIVILFHRSLWWKSRGQYNNIARDILSLLCNTDPAIYFTRRINRLSINIRHTLKQLLLS